MLARCNHCRHVWAVFWLPIRADLIGHYKCVCPACTKGPKGIVVASALDEAIFMQAPPGRPVYSVVSGTPAPSTARGDDD
jgi:hypothetical protein